MKHLIAICSLLLFSTLLSAQIIQRFPAHSFNISGYAKTSKYFFFIETQHGPISSSQALWQMDSTCNFTKVSDNVSSRLQVINDTVYYSRHDTALRYDGSTSSPVDIRYFRELTELNGKWYYSYINDIYYYDPATRISTLAYSYSTAFAGLLNMSVVNNKLCFEASSIANGTELYEYDPVANSFNIVADINPGPGNGFNNLLHNDGSKIYFDADDGTHGMQLYEYDGIHQVKQLTHLSGTVASAGPGSFPFEYYVMAYDGDLYFSIQNVGGAIAAIQDTLFKYEVASGTVTPLANVRSINSHAVYNNKLFFRGSGSNVGSEIWIYDGQSAPYYYDMTPGTKSSVPLFAFEFKNWLYFTATNASFNRELCRLFEFPTSVHQTSLNPAINIYPNPVKDLLHIEFTLQQDEWLSIAITGIDGKTIYNSGMRYYKAGKNAWNIETKKLPVATYIYRVTTAQGQPYASGKIIKE